MATKKRRSKPKSNGQRTPPHATAAPLRSALAPPTAPRNEAQFPSSRVRPPKAGEIVARRLRNRIVRGELNEGAMLPSEQELVRQFGVSRPTLREALRILESERLLEITRGLKGGARVLNPTIEAAAQQFAFVLQREKAKLSDAYMTRVMIEPAAVRQLAQARRPQTVARLRACLQDAAQAKEPVANALAFSRFHHLLIEETGNTTLILLMRMLSTILDRYLVSVGAVYGNYVEAREQTARARRSRDRLVNLIEEGNETEAAKLWRGYLREAAEKLREWQPTDLVVDLLQDD